MDKMSRDEQIRNMGEEMVKGMDFTYVVDEILGNELTEEQKRAKEADKKLFEHIKK